MARPKKTNADYFSHDNDMRNDERLLSVRRKYWHTWYSIWNMLLEKLCKSSFFEIKYDDMRVEFLSWDFQIDPKELKDIIDYFIKIWLLQEEDDKIYCKKLIDRFDWLISKRTRDVDRLSTTKTQDKIVIASENTQSRVKESKVKENIEYKNIENLLHNQEYIDDRWIEILEEFVNHRSETDSKWKQKRQKQKTWDTRKRLFSWKKNKDTNFGRNVIINYEDINNFHRWAMTNKRDDIKQYFRDKYKEDEIRKRKYRDTKTKRKENPLYLETSK